MGICADERLVRNNSLAPAQGFDLAQIEQSK